MRVGLWVVAVGIVSAWFGVARGDPAPDRKKTIVFLASVATGPGTHLGAKLEQTVAAVNARTTRLKAVVVWNLPGTTEGPIAEQFVTMPDSEGRPHPAIAALSPLGYSRIAPEGLATDVRFIELPRCKNARIGDEFLRLMQNIDSRFLAVEPLGSIVLFSRAPIPDSTDAIHDLSVVVYDNDPFAKSIFAALGLKTENLSLVDLPRRAAEDPHLFGTYLAPGMVFELEIDALRDIWPRMSTANRSAVYVLGNDALFQVIAPDGRRDVEVEKDAKAIARVMADTMSAFMDESRRRLGGPIVPVSKSKAMDSVAEFESIWLRSICRSCQRSDWKQFIDRECSPVRSSS